MAKLKPNMKIPKKKMEKKNHNNIEDERKKKENKVNLVVWRPWQERENKNQMG